MNAAPGWPAVPPAAGAVQEGPGGRIAPSAGGALLRKR